MVYAVVNASVYQTLEGIVLEWTFHLTVFRPLHSRVGDWEIQSSPILLFSSGPNSTKQVDHVPEWLLAIHALGVEKKKRITLRQA